MRTCIKALMSSKFCQIRSLVSMATYSVIICHFFSVVLDGILFILTGNDDIHESLDEFEIGQIRPLVSMATDKNLMAKTASPLFIGCFSSDPFHTCR